MKRAAVLLFIIFACVAGFLSIRGSMPFMPVFGSSMEPALQSGSLLIIKPVEVTEIQEGDIIVYNVPRYFREYYDYPPIIAHRIIEVSEDHLGLCFQTKGDNASIDPFVIRPQDIRGTFSSQISYFGFPFLFFQSEPGAIFVIFVIVLLIIFLYSKELSRGSGRLFRTMLSPVFQENYRANLMMSERFEATEKAIDNFANAMQLYAQHLASHTSAIQGLSEASHELKGSAAEQNRVLSRMTKMIRQQRSREEVSRVERVVYNFERRTLEALQAKQELEERIQVQEREVQEEIISREKVQPPPGCVVNPKVLLARTHHSAI
jgi:signal peptidase I